MARRRHLCWLFIGKPQTRMCRAADQKMQRMARHFAETGSNSVVQPRHLCLLRAAESIGHIYSSLFVTLPIDAFAVVRVLYEAVRPNTFPY